MLKQVVIFCAFLAIAAASLAYADLDPIPQKFKGQQGCYLKELDKVAAFGSTTPSKQRCVEYRCGERHVTIAGCGVLAVQDPCYTVTDETKPYPYCCPKPVCPPK